MGFAISSNSASLLAQRNLNASQMGLNNSFQRLSSGLRINSTQDQAESQAIADRMRAQTEGLSPSRNNDSQALTELQTRDGELSNVAENLDRMLGLRTQADGGLLNAQDREAVEMEFAAHNNEINRLADANNQLAYRPDYTAAMGTRDGSLQSAEDIRKAMDTVNGMRSDLGVRQNALTQSIVGSSQPLNLSTSRPRITDVGVASEAAELTRAQMLQQGGSALLSQANASPQQVLALLRAH